MYNVRVCMYLTFVCVMLINCSTQCLLLMFVLTNMDDGVVKPTCHDDETVKNSKVQSKEDTVHLGTMCEKSDWTKVTDDTVETKKDGIETVYVRKDYELRKIVTELLHLVKQKVLDAMPLLEHVKQKIIDYSLKFKTDNVIIVGSVGNGLFYPELGEDGVYCIEVDMMFERSYKRLMLPLGRAEKRQNVPYVTVRPVPRHVPDADGQHAMKSGGYIWLNVEKDPFHFGDLGKHIEDKACYPQIDCDLGKEADAITYETKPHTKESRVEHSKVSTIDESAMGFEREEIKTPSLVTTEMPLLENFETKYYFELDDLSGNIYLHNTNMRNDVPEVRVGKTVFDEIELDQTLDFNRPFRTFRTSHQTHKDDSGKVFNFFCLFDKVVSINLSWPEIAKGWIIRTREWPPKSIINTIVEHGCHVIPKRSSGQNGSNRDWKYTFSTAEQTLTLHFSETQRLCYILIKQLKRKYLSMSSMHDGNIIMDSGLTSYHLKTIMLWVCEKITPEVWDADPMEGITAFFEMLLKTLKEGYCPNYFIPEINIYERIWSKETVVVAIQDNYRDQFQHDRLLPLIEKVQEILAEPLKYFTKDMLTALDDSHSKAKTSKTLREDPVHGMLSEHRDRVDKFYDYMDPILASWGLGLDLNFASDAKGDGSS